MVTVSGRVFSAFHAHVTVEGVIMDGQYGASDTVRVGDAAHYFTLRNAEVRRSTRDLIDIGDARGVLIENSLIHHALNAANGRTDAHGIVAGAVQDLTIRQTEIHTFSGDGFQVDPGRSAPGWNRVTIEDSRIWLAPLPRDAESADLITTGLDNTHPQTFVSVRPARMILPFDIARNHESTGT